MRRTCACRMSVRSPQQVLRGRCDVLNDPQRAPSATGHRLADDWRILRALALYRLLLVSLLLVLFEPATARRLFRRYAHGWFY